MCVCVVLPIISRINVIITDIYDVPEKGCVAEKDFFFLYIYIPNPNTITGLYVELMAGEMLFRAPIAEDL